jgi:sulfate transport system permease protein
VSRAVILGAALLTVAFFLVLPLAAVFVQAFGKGWVLYLEAIRNPETLSAIRLTLFVSSISVILNLAFGLAVSWTVAKFRFPGKNLLITLIDLPLAVSPVISGLIFVLIFGLHGWFGQWLSDHDIQIIFAVPGMVLATTFITVPFVARELIPFMQAQGQEEEEAAAVLGAGGLKTFLRITLPNIKWSLLYGVMLASSRSMGEFGAVSVVSGHIRGETITVPLQVEILYNEYNYAAAFAVASLLSLLAVATLIAKKIVEWKSERRQLVFAAEEKL